MNEKTTYTLAAEIRQAFDPDNVWFTSDTPVTAAQKRAFARLKDCASDVVEISVRKGESLKEAIGQRIALLSGNIRYVYVGSQPLEDFRYVCVDRSAGLTEADVDAAIGILK